MERTYDFAITFAILPEEEGFIRPPWGETKHMSTFTRSCRGLRARAIELGGRKTTEYYFLSVPKTNLLSLSVPNYRTQLIVVSNGRTDTLVMTEINRPINDFKFTYYKNLITLEGHGLRFNIWTTWAKLL